MKPIKFDLPMNGIKISTLEQLQDNLTPQILEHFRSGKLVKWLRSRSLDEQAVAVDALLAADIQDEVQLFKKLCEVFEIEVDDDIAADMIEDYKTSSSENAKEAEPEQKTTSDNATEDAQEAESEQEEANQDESAKETEQTKLFETGDEQQRIELAARPDLLEKLQEKLANTGTPEVREALAVNSSLTEKMQNYLATTGNKEVKCQLAKNLSLIPAIQSAFANNTDYSARDIKIALAGNTSLDAVSISKLLKDDDEDIRGGLAKNPSLLSDIQQHIVNTETNGYVLICLAQSPSLCETVMEKLADSYAYYEDWWRTETVKERLAMHPFLPEFLQARLIENNHGSVLEALAINPVITLAQQAELAKVGDVDVRLALLDNQSLDGAVKARILVSFEKYDLTSKENRLESVRKDLLRLNQELSKAEKKETDSIMGVRSMFTSEKKATELEQEVRRLSRRSRHTERKVDKIESEIGKLEKILNSRAG